MRLTERMKSLLNEPEPSISHGLLSTHFATIFPSRKVTYGVSHAEMAPQAREKPKRRYPWTMTHSFYAIMGGFAFDTEKAEPNFLPGSRTRLCLTLQGLIDIATKEPILLPDISKTEIQDKSKASGLAKCLVCFQAVWYCLQCVDRLVQGYSIGLLELNVFGHALCALLIYSLWWRKPLDVSEPSLLEQSERAWELCAFLSMVGSSGTTVDFDYIVRFQQPPVSTGTQWADLRWTLVQCLRYVIHPKSLLDEYSHMRLVLDLKGDPASRHCPGSADTPLEHFVTVDSNQSEQDGSLSRLREGETMFGFRCEIQRWPYWSRRPQDNIRQDADLCCTLDLDTSDVRRLALCSKAIQCYRPTESDFGRRGDSVSDRMPNWPHLAPPKALDINTSSSSYPLLYGFTIAGCLYGGLHLLAWDAPFVSRAEKVVWRFSGTFIASSGPALILGRCLHSFLDRVPSWIASHASARRIDRNLAYASNTVFIVAYVLARIYLVLECFLQLARLPQSTYQQPSWSQYFPHIT